MMQNRLKVVLENLTIRFIHKAFVRNGRRFFVAFLWEPVTAPFFVGERRVRVRGIQDSGDYGGDRRGYYEALHGAFKGE